MKPFEYYSCQDIDYPEKPTRPTLDKSATPDEIRAYTTDVENYYDLMKKYESEKQAYHEERSKREIEFKSDMFKEEGVTDNPKVEKCYSLAYEYGHSAGYSDIHAYFTEFVELIK